MFVDIEPLIKIFDIQIAKSARQLPPELIIILCGRMVQKNYADAKKQQLLLKMCTKMGAHKNGNECFGNRQ